MLLKNRDCGFFIWEQELIEERARDQIAPKKSELEEKVAKLKSQKKALEQIVIELKVDVGRHAKGERLVVLGLIVSWFFFAVVMFVMYGK